MSTKIHDFATHAHLGVSVAPDNYTAEETGTGIDLLTADGNGYAVLAVGAITGDTVFTATLEESHDQSTWVEIAVTPPTAAEEQAVAAVTFPRSRRYVRAVLAVTGEDADGNACVLIGGQKKTV